MSKHRHALPQLKGGQFLTDGGIETTLIFHDGYQLPYFAAFTLLGAPDGRAALRRYYERHAHIAVRAGVGFVLESPTWRANADWGRRLGYSAADLAGINRSAIDLMVTVRDWMETRQFPMVISGCIGPRSDGYIPGQIMSPDHAERYHRAQINTFAATATDQVTAVTMTNVEEGIGIARAAQRAGIPSVIGFTLETDGRFPTGQPLVTAIEAVDEATDAAPAYYMVNCAHPEHFENVFAGSAPALKRIGCIRANASRRSHAELDEAPDLDDGDPAELGSQYSALLDYQPQINVLGGCCGTDHRHIDAICRACIAA